MKPFFVLLASLTLAACSGGGAGSDDFDTENPDPDTIVSTAQNAFETLNNLDQDQGLSPFSAAAAETGTVIYSGAAIMTTGTDDGITQNVDYAAIGEFTITADFGSSQNVSGTASGFFELSNPEVVNGEDTDFLDITVSVPIDGSLSFDLEIALSSGDAVIEGAVDGTLTRSDGTILEMNDGVARGGFFGDGLDAIQVSAVELEGEDFVDVIAVGLR